MSNRVNQTILRALRREETHLLAQIHDPDDGLKVRIARFRARLRKIEGELTQALRDLAEVRKEIKRREKGNE